MKQLIQSFEKRMQIRFGSEARAGVRATGCHTKCGADPMTGHVRDRKRQMPILQFLPIEIVPPGLVGGSIPPRDVKPSGSWRRLGKKPLLNRPCNLQVLGDLGAHLRLLESGHYMQPDLVGHYRGSKSSQKQKGCTGE